MHDTDLNDQTGSEGAAQAGDAMSRKESLARLEAFASSLATKRKEAVEGRAQSGIEKIWQEDEDYYNGIDEANRESEATKPATSAGRVTYGRTNESERAVTQSKIFVNITQPYVDMASARLADMLLPTDDRPFGMKPTPMPDILDAKKAGPDEKIMMPNGVAVAAAQVADQMIREAKARAEKAELRIWDWLVESGWHAEMRVVIEESARIGTGVLKGPYPERFKKRSITRQEDGSRKIVMVDETRPKSKAVSAWNVFPDPACGDSIHNGSYVWERDNITAKVLRDLKGTLDDNGVPIYLEDQIDELLIEGPDKKYRPASSLSSGSGKQCSDREQFEIWYFHGLADAEDLRAAGCECDDGESIPVEVTMVNDRIIKVAVSPLDSGEFPYDVFRWSRVSGEWAGRGVARQIRTPQRIVNGASRHMMDNAGLAAGGQFIVRRKGMSPANGRWEITPRKVWLIDEDSEVQDPAQLMRFIEVPMVQERLQAIINYGMQLAERVTSMPLLMMGMQGDSTKTLGGMELLNNNGSVVLRRHAKIFDDDIIERHIPRYYEWLLLHGDDESEKGDLLIDARGSSALFERDAQNQAMLQMGNMVKDPAFKIDPAKWFAEVMKGQRLDPHKFQYTEEEWQELQSKMQNQGPPPDPRIEVAKMRGEVDKERIAADREEARAQREHERAMQELALKTEMLKYAGQRQMGLDKVKAQLADTVMTLKTQRDLATAKVQDAAQVAQPAVEPAGRAPEGQAFQR